MMIRHIQPLRRLVEALQAFLIIGLPFLRIKGESALRFDVPSLRLHFFGASIWMDEFFIVLVALIFFTFLIAFVTLVFGRIWCGWLCPQTVLVDFTRFLDRAPGRGLIYRTLSYAAVFLMSALVAASLTWYFVSPYDFFGGLLTGELGTVVWGSWIVLTGVLFLNFTFLRHTFCATVCPYAKMQSSLFDNRTLVIAFDRRREEECMNCEACVRVCPVGIDIRKGLSAACINCAECIDTCSDIMARKKRSALIGYFFGLPGERGKIIRPNALLIGVSTALSFVFLLYLSFSRLPFDMTVLPHESFSPRIASDERAVNAYLLSLENRGKSDLELELGASGDSFSITITPERVHLSAGEHRRVPVYAVMKDFGKRGVTVTIVLSASSTGSKRKVTGKASFIVPEA